jgi:hypothetical protein
MGTSRFNLFQMSKAINMKTFLLLLWNANGVTEKKPEGGIQSLVE